ncbi:MAG: homocysteine S-methyltransferase family protein [Prevotella sp.]
MWKENLEETKRHYIQWWNHKGLVLNMWEHFQEGVAPHGPYSSEEPVHLSEALRNDYGTGAFNLPGSPRAATPEQRWFDPEWRAEYLDWYVGHSCLKADMLPVANTQLGPGSLAAILGARLEGGEDTIWIHPDPHFSDKLVFDKTSEAYLIHKRLLEACKRRAAGNYYVGMPDLMEGLDVLAAMKGTDKVLLDTVMQPEVLEEQLQFINNVYFEVFDELYDIIREGDEMAFCYFSLWAPAKMTKLQSDISTMISTADYRRFVQPYLREQCQKIPYTLYHLDGVGALHHLPAILEIDELKAIQWTPGVGEPQGGDKKWYSLYRQILDAGKSVMCCWVTIDQLRPLLDNIGADGVHLEMDFHNEREVEQAMRIVEEYQTAEAERKVDECISIGESVTLIQTEANAARYRPQSFAEPVSGGVRQLSADNLCQTSAEANDSEMSPEDVLSIERRPIADVMRERILVLDGGMGTMVQQYGLRGCSDEFAVTRPDIISDIHRRYLSAGADIIETDTFSSQRISLADYGWQHRVRELNLAACRLARRMADAFTMTNPQRPRYVAGSIGPTNKCVSFSTSGPRLTRETLHDAYAEQIDALIDGNVDVLLIETIFDMENAYVCLSAAADVMRGKGVSLPVMLSFSQVNANGKNMNGQDMYEFLERVGHDFATTGGDGLTILSVGVNCTSEPASLVPLVIEMSRRLPCPISIYGNAGMPDSHGHYAQTADDFARQNWTLIDRHAVNIVGGCCGTTDHHIRLLHALVEPVSGCHVSPHAAGHTDNVAHVQDASPAADTRHDEPQETSSADNGTPADEDKSSQTELSLRDAIIAGDQDAALAATKRELERGAVPADLVNTQMIQAMAIVGQRFENGTAFVPQLLMAGRAMKAALGVLKPVMEARGDTVESMGRIVIGTVKGDLHDIGKNLVASMLEGAGFEVVNIGIDVDADTFVNAVVDNKADILCLSALLTTTMTYMTDVLAALEKAGMRDKVKVMVGGAPVSAEFADEIGADGYSSNANEAVALAKRLMDCMKG